MNEHYPKISVIMPVYNGEDVIRYALNSLLWQTCEDWECIIVNDGSTDGTKDILDSLSDTRFRIVHLVKNGGRGNARQKALELVRGKYIAFLDADDWYTPEKLKEQSDFLEKNQDVDLIGGAVLSYGNKSSIKTTRGAGTGKIYIYRGGPLHLIHGNVMFRTVIADGVSYNTTYDYGEDEDFMSRCLLNKAYTISDKIWYYYNELDSITIPKMRKATWELFCRVRTVKHLLKYLFWCIIAPILGIDYMIKRRGKTPTTEDIERFEYLYAHLKHSLAE